ncbi:flippase-like domain-containing protein, partial [bacterium]|nr:flippase-like domain-containing protein [bacterium]
MKSRTIQVFLAIVIGVICLYFFQKQVKWGEVWQAMQHVEYSWVVLAVLLNLLSILIRAIRWQAFLGEPKVKVWNLFLIANIGFMGNGIFPARMGELIRPFLVWRTTKHTFPTALATIVVERVYDLLGLLLILAFVLYVFPFPVTPAGTIEPGPTVEQSIAPELEEVPAEAAKKTALQIDNPFEWIKGLAKYGVILFLLLFSALGTMTFAPQWSLIVAEKVFSPLPKSLSEKL